MNNTSASNDKQENWWKTRSKLEKWLLIIAMIATLLLLTILILFFVFYPNSYEVCTTAGCVRSSMELLNNMDLTVNPCDDFYKFVCGNFQKNKKRDDNHYSKSVEGKSRLEVKSVIRNLLEKPIGHDDPGIINAKKYYRMCMNETVIDANSINSIKQVFKSIGGWPTLDGNQMRDNNFNWREAMLKFKKIGLRFDYLIDIMVEEDDENPPRRILRLGIPYTGIYVNQNDTIKQTILEFMTDIAVIFGADRNRARTDMLAVYDFVLKISKIAEDIKLTNGSTNTRLSISELQYKFPSINWFEFLNSYLSPAAKLTYEDVVVTSEVYLRKLLETIRSVSKRTIANFMFIHIVDQFEVYLPATFIERAGKFFEDMSGREYTKGERWLTCLEEVFRRFSTLLSTAYVDLTYDREVRDQVIDLYKKIKDQFKRTLDQIEWIDESTKKLVRHKIVTSTESIVTSSDIYENDDRFHSHHNIVINESNPIKTFLNMKQLSLNNYYQRLNEEVKPDKKWDCDYLPTSTDVSYSPKANNMVIAAGLLQEGLYFSKHRPRYMNYGTFGPIFARELTSIFGDAEDHKSNGKLRDKWSTSTLYNYDKKTKCIADQYGNFYIPEIDEFLNSSNTKDSDVADQASFKIAYEAYVRWADNNEAETILPGLDYTPKQLFWISSAVTHCAVYDDEDLRIYIKHYTKSPQNYRVIGTLQNLENFANDFDCPRGSKMNPAKKCVVW